MSGVPCLVMFGVNVTDSTSMDLFLRQACIGYTKSLVAGGIVRILSENREITARANPHLLKLFLFG